MPRTRRFIAGKHRTEEEYEEKLQELVDEIYDAASDIWEWSWVDLADRSYLAYNTVYRLGMRTTRYPRLMTIYKLAKAVGMDMNLVRQRVAIRRAA